MNKYEIGIVLGGGGARGFAHQITCTNRHLPDGTGGGVRGRREIPASYSICNRYHSKAKEYMVIL